VELRLESCRLVELENQILGVERQGDLPGEMIPYCYFEYLRTAQAFKLVPIFHHNAIDILSLACLTAIVPFAFRSPGTAMLRHGADWIGLARWMQQAGVAKKRSACSAARWKLGYRITCCSARCGCGRSRKRLGHVKPHWRR